MPKERYTPGVKRAVDELAHPEKRKKILKKEASEKEKEENIKNLVKELKEEKMKLESRKKKTSEQKKREREIDKEVEQLKQDIKKSGTADIEDKFDLSEKELEDNEQWFESKSEDLAQLEEEWFKKGEKLNENNLLTDIKKIRKEKKKQAIATQEESLESYYEQNMEKIGLSYEEYADSVDIGTLLTKQQEKVENYLFSEFGYDVTRGGAWKRFKTKRKLDPADVKMFDNMVRQYKVITKAYNKHSKKHNKKYADAMSQLTPGTKNRAYTYGRLLQARG